MGHYSSFILRLWVEPEQGWRWGLIEHVATRERLRFSSHAEMLEFIQSHSDVNELSLPFTLENEDSSSPTYDGTNGTEGSPDAPAAPEKRRKVKNGT